MRRSRRRCCQEGIQQRLDLDLARHPSVVDDVRKNVEERRTRMAFRFRLHRRVHHVDSVVRRRGNLLAQHVRLAERHLRQVESSVMLRV